MNYGDIIKQAARIFWQNKRLWIFGIILALVGRGEYQFGVSYQESFSYSPGTDQPPDVPNPFKYPLVADFLENPIPYIMGLSILSLIWWLISNFVGWLAQGALIGMVDEIDRTGSSSIGSGWTTAKQRIRPLFSLAILFALPQFIILIPVFAGGIWLFLYIFNLFEPAFRGEFPPSEQLEAQFLGLLPIFLGSFACLLPLICLGGILGWALNLLGKITARSCVLENLNVMASLRRGWHLIRTNIGYTLLNWLLLVAIGSVFGIVAAIPALLLWIPTTPALLYGNWTIFSIATGILIIFYFLVVTIGAGGILTSFNATLWTLLYKGFVDKEQHQY